MNVHDNHNNNKHVHNYHNDSEHNQNNKQHIGYMIIIIMTNKLVLIL